MMVKVTDHTRKNTLQQKTVDPSTIPGRKEQTMTDLVRRMFKKNDCEEMANYIIRTNMPENPNADLRGREYKKLFKIDNKADAIYIAFLLGVARGYRIRKSSEKRERKKNKTQSTKAFQIVDAFNALPEAAQENLYPLFEAFAEGRATKQDLIAELNTLVEADQKEAITA